MNNEGLFEKGREVLAAIREIWPVLKIDRYEDPDAKYHPIRGTTVPLGRSIRNGVTAGRHIAAVQQQVQYLQKILASLQLQAEISAQFELNRAQAARSEGISSGRLKIVFNRETGEYDAVPI